MRGIQGRAAVRTACARETLQSRLASRHRAPPSRHATAPPSHSPPSAQYLDFMRHPRPRPPQDDRTRHRKVSVFGFRCASMRGFPLLTTKKVPRVRHPRGLVPARPEQSPSLQRQGHDLDEWAGPTATWPILLSWRSWPTAAAENEQLTNVWPRSAHRTARRCSRLEGENHAHGAPPCHPYEVLRRGGRLSCKISSEAAKLPRRALHIASTHC